MSVKSLTEQSNSTSTGRLVIWTLAIALLANFLVQIPELWDQYRVVKDVQNLYQMARFQDSTLFSHDPQIGFGAVEIGVLGRHLLIYPRSLGYGLLFYGGSFLINYIWLIKWLSFGLMALSVLYLFKLGQLLGNDDCALSLSLLFIFFILASYQSISIGSGLQRAFSVPLIIVFIYYLVANNYLGAGLVLVASTLIYLPNFPVMAMTYTLSLINFKGISKWSLIVPRSRLWAWMGTIFLSILVISFALAVELKLISFTTNTATEQSQSSLSGEMLYHSQDYAELYFGFPFLGRAGILDSGSDAINVIVLFIFVMLIYAVVGRRSVRRLPDVFSHLLIASIIMYALSMVAIFGLSSLALYYPSRYTRVTLFVLPLCFVGLNWPLFLEKLPAWWRRNIRLCLFFVLSLGLTLALVYFLLPSSLPVLPLLWLFGLILSGVLTVWGGSYVVRLIAGYTSLAGRSRITAIVAVAAITVFLGGSYIKTLGLRPIDPSKSARNVYQFIATLPKDALIAGEPELMAGVPLFSQRSVLFSALHPNLDAPILDYFDMQYAESPEKVLNFCQDYKVNYLVLDTTNFAPQFLANKQFFYQPYNDLIVDMVATRSHFVLPRFHPIYTSDPYVVIQCDAKTVLASHQD
ncbi:MAG: hypothetical protein H6632_02145 [Anaerolineales bacterium]|nr:hypothetical protein [Anaerolineales bacterium]